MESSNQFLGTERIGKLMQKYAIPCIISLLVGALYNIVDQIFIANASYLGSYGNAANTVVFPLTVVALAIAVMIGDGCCAFVSISLGQDEVLKAKRSVTLSIGNALALVHHIHGAEDDMSVELTTKFAPYTDELFKAESKIALLTNSDFDWTGAHAVKVYKISTSPMNDYARNRSTAPEDSSESLSRYGDLLDLSATTEELLLKYDRSFIFNVDRLDIDETQGQLEAGTALARELREVVVPEVDANVYKVMATGAGHKPTAAALTKSNIYAAVLAASQALDDAEVPETERVLVVTPATYVLLKQAVEFDHTDIGADMRARGVVAMIDGAPVVKVPAVRLPENACAPVRHRGPGQAGRF